jgi:HK97 gp10 family phage protein
MTERQQVKYEERIDETKKKIREKPRAALKAIGKFLVKEIRKEARRSKKTRTYYYKGKKIKVKPGRLRRSIGYWNRRRENDLQVGSKSWYAQWEEFGSVNNPRRPFIRPAVMKNVSVIQSFIKQAMKELTRDK